SAGRHKPQAVAQRRSCESVSDGGGAVAAAVLASARADAPLDAGCGPLLAAESPATIVALSSLEMTICALSFGCGTVLERSCATRLGAL
ncbi:MAG TPA: hypothetical protein VN817_08485, partial [Solirubrobacteraceae bacterium]|nr:hypothetical protein [Solirubrobacteraceae bacterium]